MPGRNCIKLLTGVDSGSRLRIFSVLFLYLFKLFTMSINYLIIFKKANRQTTFLVFASSLVLPVQNLAGCGQWAHSGGSASIWASLGRYSLWSPRSLPTWRQGGFVIPAMTLPSSSQQKFSEALSAPSGQSWGGMIPASRCSWSSGSKRCIPLQGPTALSFAGPEQLGQLCL